jgi:xanthine dehydrogenase accessory factor
MFDLDALTAAVRVHGKVARVVIASHDGSSPRETGTAMLVWQNGQSGTIGGGALEHQATQTARAQTQTRHVARIPLGPALGQCCGGAVTLVTEVYDASNLPEPPVVARSLDGSPMPLAVKRLLAAARNQGTAPATQFLQGWLIEPVSHPTCGSGVPATLAARLPRSWRRCLTCQSPGSTSPPTASRQPCQRASAPCPYLIQPRP